MRERHVHDLGPRAVGLRPCPECVALNDRVERYGVELIDKEEGIEVLGRKLEEAEASHDALLEACKEALEGFRLTREYMGEQVLPEIKGWSWFDACNTLTAAIKTATSE